MKKQDESLQHLGKKELEQKTPNGEDQVSLSRFLKFCEQVKRKPSKELAKLWLFGDNYEEERGETSLPPWVENLG